MTVAVKRSEVLQLGVRDVGARAAARVAEPLADLVWTEVLELGTPPLSEDGPTGHVLVTLDEAGRAGASAISYRAEAFL